LRHALWRIRKAIEPDQTGAPYLISDDLAVSFNAGADYWLDVAILLRDGDTLQELIEQVSVFRGPLLPGFYDDWVVLEREHLDALLQQKMQRLLGRLLAEGRWAEVLEWGERWVALGHAPEPGYRALMRAHAELGDRSRVAVVYQRCREALLNELGVEPSIQTRRLYEDLRGGTEATAAVLPTITDPDMPAPGEPPYQGMRYFDEGDAERFFGRERLTARLLARLRTEPFVAVLGASGSGKSSVVRAGLVPALRQMQAVVHALTPTLHPIDSLAAAFCSNGERPALLAELRRDPHGLRRFLERKKLPATTLVVDQFEELFTLCQDPFEREAFADNLLGATLAGGPATVVIALRADFYAHCAEYASLREAIAQHQEYVGPMDATEMRRAIEGPADRSDWGLEPGLVELVLRDAGDEPGALPLLSHALLETWRRRRGRRLTLGGYTAAGGVQGAIAQTAETVFTEQLTPQQQAIARRVFLQLTELGEGTQDTRRRAALDELVRRRVDESAVLAVLRALADARLIALGDETAEVALEALIREWSRLRTWLTEDRERLRIRRQLTSAAQEWERLGRDAGSLYRGARLLQAVDQAADQEDELGALEQEFVGASVEATERETAEREAQRQRELEVARQLADAEQRRAEVERQHANVQRRAASQLRQRAALLGAAFAIALVFGGVAAFFGTSAGQHAARAEADSRAATSRAFAAAALTAMSADPERAGLLALEAVDTTFRVDGTRTTEAEDALHRVAPLLRAQLTLAGHGGPVATVAFSPDGTTIATGGQDGTARMWDAATGQLRLNLSGHTGPVNAVAFSPGANLVPTASSDGTVRLWDAITGQPRLVLGGRGREAERLAFSPDGQWLAATSLDGMVRLWDTASGASGLTFQPARLADSPAAIDVAFSPDGSRLATALPEGEVDEWELSGGQPRLLRGWQTSQYGGTSNGHTVAFTPDGIRIAATTDTGVQTWWTSTGEPDLSIVGDPVQILHMAVSPDGTRIATASLDRTAKVWDARSGRELLSLAGHQAAIDQVAFSPDGQRLATASRDGTAMVWDLRPSREALTLTNAGTGSVNKWPQQQGPRAGPAVLSSNADRLLAGLDDGSARVWDTRTGGASLTLTGHRGKVWGAAISSDGSRLATGGSDGTVRVWDAGSGGALWTGSAHGDTVLAVTFSPDGTQLASTNADGTVQLWSSATGQNVLTLSGHVGPLASVAFSPDGTHLASASQERGDPIRIWDVRSGDVVRNLAGHEDAVWSVAFSPDGTRLLSASRDGTARIWDVGTATSTVTLQGHGTVVSSAFSPDGLRVATGNRDGAVQLWDAATGQDVLDLTGTEVGEGIDSLAFSSDGRELAVRGDQAIRLYVLPIEDLTALVRSRLTRWWTLEECRRFLHVAECPPDRLHIDQNPSLATAAPGFVGQSGPATGAEPAQISRHPLAEGPAVPVPLVVPGSNVSGSIKIVSSLPHGGIASERTDSIINAFKMALAEHNGRVAGANVTYIDMDDAAYASNESADGPTETGNANQAVNDPTVMVYLGPLYSGSARQAIPILCRAGIAMISFSNTYPGLTGQHAYNAPGEPDSFYPNCSRNYTRVVATDDVQGAVGAEFARRLGATRVYALHDSGAAPEATTATFADTASRLGLRVVGGPEGVDLADSDYRAVARKVREGGADLVYWGGSEVGGSTLWRDLRAELGPTVQLMGPDGINNDGFVAAAGSAAEGTYATFPGVLPAQLEGKGADWYQRYKQQFHSEPDPMAAYAYEAMNVALAAIERTGKVDRAAIRDAIIATQDYNGILGRWSFTPTGDTTLTRMSVRQVRNGKWDDSTLQIIDAPR
jgi:WD40 repeat protein/ABC-type branched-subunit amino acid transport system substrate-binding protein